MKVYPKVPRYDHPVVPPDFFDIESLALVEKVDGSSFRFTLYDELYRTCYPEQVIDAAIGDGSLVFGTRKTIRGSHRDSLEAIDGALHRAVRCLREGINRAALRRLHDEFDGPVIVYAENLVYSTLDYPTSLILTNSFVERGPCTWTRPLNDLDAVSMRDDGAVTHDIAGYETDQMVSE